MRSIQSEVVTTPCQGRGWNVAPVTSTLVTQQLPVTGGTSPTLTLPLFQSGKALGPPIPPQNYFPIVLNLSQEFSFFLKLLRPLTFLLRESHNLLTLQPFLEQRGS